MTTTADHHETSTMGTFNPVMPTNKPPGDPTLGVDNTQKIQRFLTPIKLEFVVAASQTSFNLAKAHHEVLKLLKDKDPTLEVVPSKDTKASFNDLKQFPANDTDYNAKFDHAVQKEPTEARKILVRHSLLTNLKFSDLKFQNAKLMEHMFKNKIYIRYNQSESLQVAALGFMQDVHPRITFRDHFSHNLSEAIHLEMTDDEQSKINELLPPPKNSNAEEGEIVKPDIKLEAYARTIGYGNDEGRIKTEAFEIRVPLAIRLPIKEILTRLGNQDAMPEGRFIPYGLVQSVGSEVYKKMIRMQNVFLTNFRTIPVFGILPSALEHIIKLDNNDGTSSNMTLRQYITQQPSINGIETTNRASDLGKIFIKSDAFNILNARAFIDDVIPQLYATAGLILPAMILEAFNPPRRGDAPRTSTNFQSYASILANLGNPQGDEQAIPGGDAPPPRPPKRNVQMVYDLTGDFPNLPRRHNQNARHQSQPQDDQPSTITASHANPSTAPAVTVDALAKFKEDMKREFMTMIQTEVKTQIETQMKALQADVQTLSAKFDGVQEGIKESIGETVRLAVLHGMHTQPTQRLHTQQSNHEPAQTENTQDGACPMQTGTGL